MKTNKRKTRENKQTKDPQMSTPTATPRTLKAAGNPLYDWESTAERLFIESQKLETELAAECERVRVLREALVFIIKCGGMNIDTELGDIRCNGSWCAEQARAALAATQEARK